MKFLACNDLHFDSATPKARTDSYPEELLGLLDQIKQLAEALKVDAILMAGDQFHRWNAWGGLMPLLQWCRSLSIPVITVPGNHDLEHNRLESLSKTALGILFETGAMIDVSEKDHLVKANGQCIAISGVPFPDAFSFDAWAERAAERDTNVDGAIVLGHCFTDINPGDYWGELVHGYSDLKHLPWDVFIFGHDHRDQGVMKIEGKWFVALPALARGTLTDEDITRDVKVALIDYQTPKPLLNDPGGFHVKQVRLKARPAAEIFDLTERAQMKAERQAVTAFVERLKADLQQTAPTINVRERVAALALTDVVRARVYAYLDESEQAQ